MMEQVSIVKRAKFIVRTKRTIPKKKDLGLNALLDDGWCDIREGAMGATPRLT